MDLKSNIESLPPLKQIITDHDLRAQKALGQNFLLDQNITDKIVRECGNVSDHHVIEIGPGPGGLTRSLLKTEIKSLTAIEYDHRAVKALQSLITASQNRLHIIHGDALEQDILNLCPAPRAIIANLPYNIATPLLIQWLKHVHNNTNNIARMALMFQKEVADRITAKQGDKAYGRLAVLCSWLCHAMNIYTLPPSAFTPPPKVNSAVVRLIPKIIENTEKPAFKTIEKLTAAAFGQRRKMIRTSLKKYVQALEENEVDMTLRAENVPMEDYVRIAITIDKMGL